VWANASKVVAIAGTALISYLGMRLWVFVSNAQKEQTLLHSNVSAHSNTYDELSPSASRTDENKLRV
jgi:hypothetical protein